MLKKLSTAKIFLLGFFALILLGTALLTLPISARSGQMTHPFDAAFTAVSATCVTGLSVFDTYTHWSGFGQAVILCLIQIGGLGFMSVISLFTLLFRRRQGLRERQLLQQASGSMRRMDTRRMFLMILCGTALIESAGAALLAIRFVPLLGAGQGIWQAVFHSVSAFCNAGFDLCGIFAPGQSVSRFTTDPLVSLTLIALITLGGIGYVVWDDVLHRRHHLSRYSLHSKIVLCTSAVLLFGGGALFFISERQGVLAGLSPPAALLASLFQSCTTRTAGFFSVDQGALSSFGLFLCCILMFIGGSPGSTAGGVKTATVFLVLSNAFSAVRGRDSLVLFRRRIEGRQVRQASAILLVYLAGALGAVGILSLYEPYPLGQLVYEVISAIATVGLTTGITTQLLPLSRALLMLLMFAGRLGALSFLLAVAEKKKTPEAQRPSESILIG